METKNINLVVITSVIHNYHPSIYSAQERFEQLINQTIKSIQDKIPNPYIVVLEGSHLNQDEKNILKNSKIDGLFYFDVNGYNKSGGELLLLLNYFESIFYQKLKNNFHIQTISKFSGRYYFTEKHKFDDYSIEDFVFKKIDNTYWSNQGIYETRYYRFPFYYEETFINKLKDILKNGMHIDIEHSFYKYNVLPIDKCLKIDKIFVAGNIAPDGNSILD
jgi:hypothetical protein